MNGVHGVGLGYKISGGFARAANTTEFTQGNGINSRIIGGLDNVVGNGIVAATRTEGRGTAFVIFAGQTNVIGLGSGFGKFCFGCCIRHGPVHFLFPVSALQRQWCWHLKSCR